MPAIWGVKVNGIGMPGQGLREIRKTLGLTLKAVEWRSRQLAEERRNPDYLFTAGRLSQVENSGSLPSIYKLAALSEIYRIPYTKLLQIYGIETFAGSASSVADSNSRSSAAEKDTAGKHPTAVWI